MPKHANPFPLFPNQVHIQSIDFNDFPSLNAFVNSEDIPDWHKQHWHWALDFLKFTERNKSVHTFTRFRSEIERFLLWAMLIKEKPIDEYRKIDILEFADFCWQPPENWICIVNHDRFVAEQSIFSVNAHWRPFRLSLPKNQSITPDKKKYKPSQQTLTATFTALTVFYKYLINEELSLVNPAQIAKKDCRYFINDAQVKDIKRLTEDQWHYVLKQAGNMADADGRYERSLFVIAALKGLFLRISELSERKDWSPVMSHFWEDDHHNWWLKVYGKGRKLRDTTVPIDFIPYLKRYRVYRGLPDLPYPGEQTPIIEKIRGQGGMTARHLARLVQEVFDSAYSQMKAEQGDMTARKLKEASTHWLRHTGASMEVERGRELKDLSEDLGHSSMATTDTIYVQTENKKRAESGKGRSVD